MKRVRRRQHLELQGSINLERCQQTPCHTGGASSQPDKVKLIAFQAKVEQKLEISRRQGKTLITNRSTTPLPAQPTFIMATYK